MSVPADVLEWVGIANDDFGLAMLLVRQRRYPALACFHAQQAAEKYIKAVLTAIGQPFPLSHDLVRVYTLYPAATGPYALQMRDLLALTPYATGARYPGFVAMPTLAEARQAVLMAGRVRRISLRRLGIT